MIGKNIFKKKDDKDDIDEYLEIPLEIEQQQHVKIVIENMDTYGSVDKVLRKVREGHIVVVKIKHLRDQDIGQLKAAVSKIKAITETLGGDIVGIGDEWIVVTPSTVKIDR